MVHLSIGRPVDNLAARSKHKITPKNKNKITMNPEILEGIKTFFKGDIENSDTVLDTYSHDASLFEVRPSLIVFPKDNADIQALVKFVSKQKEENPGKYSDLSITPRSAGTDMSGGPLNTSIILDFTRYMNHIIEVTDKYAIVEPGCYYRDLEKETLKHDAIMPAYTASKDICAVGGMVANNSGGEKNIKYGKVERYVEELDVIFADGNEYKVKALNEDQMRAKMLESTLEGAVYRKMWDLVRSNKKELADAKPKVSKNSAGYYLWNIWDEEKKVFDLCKMIVGSQGTLGFVTKIKFRLVPVAKFSNVLAVFLPDLTNLGKIVAEIVPFKPDSLESYDDYSMKLAVRFFFDFITYLGPIETLKLGLRFLPEAWMMLTGGIPKLTIIVEVSGRTEGEVKEQLDEIKEKIAHFGYKTHIARDSREAEKYWRIRRESFNLLRKHVRGKRTAPFIDDVIVPPDTLPEFLPRMQALIKEYKLVYTVAGHAGDGNFHIIPLMDLTNAYSADIILDLSKKVYDLVHEFGGSITAEHNDGIIRTPYLLQMYGEKIIGLFKETKNAFDPQNIFNPNKKVGGTFDDIRNALSKKKKSVAVHPEKKHTHSPLS